MGEQEEKNKLVGILTWVRVIRVGVRIFKIFPRGIGKYFAYRPTIVLIFGTHKTFFFLQKMKSLEDHYNIFRNIIKILYVGKKKEFHGNNSMMKFKNYCYLSPVISNKIVQILSVH